ncbi:MAG: hypothetical protein IPM82_18995 [Saprospiraceae bacterium]|nr:hypothetical protein [Saprospiraceae bacterium]
MLISVEPLVKGFHHVLASAPPLLCVLGFTMPISAFFCAKPAYRLFLDDVLCDVAWGVEDTVFLRLVQAPCRRPCLPVGR